MQHNWKEIFYYDSESPSRLRWACDIMYAGLFGESVAVKRHKGEIAGSLQKRHNRYKVKYKQKAYMVHRVIWELHNGTIPKGAVIDQIDGNSSNNDINNLRVVAQKINARNTGKKRSNKTGVNGVALVTVTYNGEDYQYYKATWSEDGKGKQKGFSVLKFGAEKAFELACEYRKSIITHLNEQGAGYTDSHGKRENG